MKNVLTRIEVAVARVATIPAVQSAARHAATAAGAVLISAIAVGGFQAINVAVIAAAAAAAIRVIQLAVVAHFKSA